MEESGQQAALFSGRTARGERPWEFRSPPAPSHPFIDCLMDSVTDILFFKTLDGVYADCNKAFAEYLGCGKDDIIGKTDCDLYPAEEAEFHRAGDRQMIARGLPKQKEEWVSCRKGRQVFLETLKTLYRDPQGKLLGIIGVSRDMTERKVMEEKIHEMNARLQQRVAERTTELKKANNILHSEIVERKQAETALRESEEKYRAIFENANDAIFVIQDEKVKIPNPAALKVTGYSFEELTFSPFIDFIHPDDRDLVLGRHRQRLLKKNVPPSYEFRIIRKNGETAWIEISATPIQWEGKPATLNFLKDITRQKKLEEQCLYAQKLEAVGTLAGGIAHDFNNILMGIQGHTSMMLFDFCSRHSHRERIVSIEDLIMSGADLTRQLLGFARKGKYEVKAVDLNRLIRKTAEMFGRTKKELKIDFTSQPGLWTVEADAGQIEQVLMNLLVNAWQAMPGGGEIRITAENVLTESTGAPAAGPPERFVKICVADTGVGMDEKTRQRIFEPFFTTKEMGRGTGLGLATVYGIVNGHNGTIQVTSEQGGGTTFHIHLPASDKKAPEETHRPNEWLKGSGTVLLVDDEEAIIDIGKDVLEALGYKVLTARSGREAVDHYQRKTNEIDLVILDMIMPGGSGGEAFDALKAVNPDVKVILSSGYSLEGQASEIMDRGCLAFIQKPYSLADLSRKVREVMDLPPETDPHRHALIGTAPTNIF